MPEKIKEKPAKRRNAVTKRNAPAARSASRFKFFTDIIAELKKVVWLSREDLLRLSAMVLIVTVIMGLILGVLDYGFSRLVNDIFLG